MNELERLLVACLEHDGQKERLRVRPGSLTVAADWVEEHSPPDVAARVRFTADSNLESILVQDDMACLDNTADNGLFLTMTRKGRGQGRYVLLELWRMEEGNTRLKLWGAQEQYAADASQQEASITGQVRLARWHAIINLLGYCPLMLLACCATEGASEAA